MSYPEIVYGEYVPLYSTATKIGVTIDYTIDNYSELRTAVLKELGIEYSIEGYLPRYRFQSYRGS